MVLVKWTVRVRGGSNCGKEEEIEGMNCKVQDQG